MALTFAAARGERPAGASALALPVLPADDDAGLAVRVGVGADSLDGLGIDADALLAGDQATGKPGEVLSVPLHRDGLDAALLVGVGDGSPAALRKAGPAAVRAAKGSAWLATTLAAERDGTLVRALVEAMGLAAYRFVQRSDDDPPKLDKVTLLVDKPGTVRRDVAKAVAVIDAVHAARDLANMPSLEKSPQWFAEQAQRLGTEAGVAVRVRDEKEMAAEGFGGVLAVGAGSSRPPRFTELTWEPKGATRHVVLVGKGITFDSGGLSLKPNEGMAAMKTDMAGGAAVVATMTALRDLEIPVKVTGLVPMAENLPSGSATRPGDVVTHYGGTTSEVLNTDAEGRLVLADALAYAVARLSPDVVVDIATLTGAAAQAFGRRYGALYTTSPAVGGGLLAAAEAAGERLWQLPLAEDYRDSLDSDIADLRNIAEPKRHYSGGSIVAALFLREFVGDVPWAHLDVAGPARAAADEDEVVKGATGFGVRTFLRWLETQH